MKARNSMKTRRGYRCIGHLGLGDSAVAVAASSLGAESSSTDPGLEVAAASATPSSGDQIPACPDEATLGKIKDADVPVGPCMPFVDATTQAEKDQALESLGDYRHPGVPEEVPESDCYGGYAASFDTRVASHLPGKQIGRSLRVDLEVDA